MADGSEDQGRKTKSRSKSRTRVFSKNPFLNFLKAFRKMPDQQNVGGKFIFKAAGEKWRNLTDAEREPYVAQAQVARDQDNRYKVRQRDKKQTISKAAKKRKCSKCGHRHGSPIADDDDGEMNEDDSVSSRSRSRSPSKSKSKSKSDSKSGSGGTTGEDYFTDDTTTTF